MEKIIIVSNRLPVSIKEKSGELTLVSSTGGLATGLNSIFEENHTSIWIGWPGIYTEQKASKIKALFQRPEHQKMIPVLLSKLQVKAFYEGFSNSTLWPLFHYFPRYTVFHEKHWNIYKEVNALFCEEILKHADDNSNKW